jgi:hypothetical protein
MPDGIPINRECVIIIEDGTPVIDWGDGQAQDLFTGEFVEVNLGMSAYTITNIDLDILVHAGRVGGYDTNTVYVKGLPEKSRPALD